MPLGFNFGASLDTTLSTAIFGPLLRQTAVQLTIECPLVRRSLGLGSLRHTPPLRPRPLLFPPPSLARIAVHADLISPINPVSICARQRLVSLCIHCRRTCAGLATAGRWVHALCPAHPAWA